MISSLNEVPSQSINQIMPNPPSASKPVQYALTVSGECLICVPRTLPSPSPLLLIHRWVCPSPSLLRERLQAHESMAFVSSMVYVYSFPGSSRGKRTEIPEKKGRSQLDLRGGGGMNGCALFSHEKGKRRRGAGVVDINRIHFIRLITPYIQPSNKPPCFHTSPS